MTRTSCRHAGNSRFGVFDDLEEVVHLLHLRKLLLGKRTGVVGRVGDNRLVRYLLLVALSGVLVCLERGSGKVRLAPVSNVRRLCLFSVLCENHCRVMNLVPCRLQNLVVLKCLSSYQLLSLHTRLHMSDCLAAYLCNLRVFSQKRTAFGKGIGRLGPIIQFVHP